MAVTERKRHSRYNLSYYFNEKHLKYKEMKRTGEHLPFQVLCLGNMTGSLTGREATCKEPPCDFARLSKRALLLLPAQRSCLAQINLCAPTPFMLWPESWLLLLGRA